jgi:hypothetical protein
MFDSWRDYWLYPAIAGAALAFGYGCVSIVHSLNAPIEEASSAQVFKPAAIVRYQRTGTPPPLPMDKRSLARAIQRELARVGCYAGNENGLWTRPTRAAMTAFVEKSNARLPTDEPDPALLSLVQAHAGGDGCAPAGDVANPAAAAGVALVAAPAAHYRIAGEAPTPAGPTAAPQAALALPQRAPDPPPISHQSIAAPAAAQIDAAVDAKSDVEAEAEARKIMAPPAPASILAKVEPIKQSAASSPAQSNSVNAPDDDLEPVAETSSNPRKRAARRKTRRYSSKPPKFVKSIMRDVNKTLWSLGF